MESRYVRHGTQPLIAARDVHTGQVLADCRERRTQDDLVAFMERVAIAYPGKQVHIFWNNLNTHRALAVWQSFNARHDERLLFHFTPLHASWGNQIALKRVRLLIEQRFGVPMALRWASTTITSYPAGPRIFRMGVPSNF